MGNVPSAELIGILIEDLNVGIHFLGVKFGGKRSVRKQRKHLLGYASYASSWEKWQNRCRRGKVNQRKHGKIESVGWHLRSWELYLQP